MAKKSGIWTLLFGTLVATCIVGVTIFSMSIISDIAGTNEPKEDIMVQENITNFRTVDPTFIQESDAPNPLGNIGEEADEQDVRDSGITETPPQSSATIDLMPAQGNGRVGRVGLMPGTPIAVVKSRQDNIVKFDACTIAFSLPGKTEHPWAITAGHCGKEGDKVYSMPKEGGTFSETTFLGTIRKVSISNYSSGTGDWSAIRLATRAMQPPHPDMVPLKLSLGKPESGTKLCKVGTTTGYNCGRKEREGVIAGLSNIGGSGDSISAKLDEVKLCALPGDSGSPVFSKRGIVGVVSSTSADKQDMESGSCRTNTSAFYVPIDEVIAQVGRSVPDVKI